MKILIILIIIVSTSLAIFIIASKPLAATAKVLLLASQEFPQIPFKPLHKITSQPLVEKVEFGSSTDGQKIVGDLFVPKNNNKKPAIIVAMGVKTSNKDRPIILGFCDTLARLGFVVLWPRREDLEKDVIKFEEVQTFVEAFNFLEKRGEVDKDRISFVGFSVGSSLSLAAAEDERVNDKVRSIVFFGGYYNILDYLTSLSTKEIVLGQKNIKWEPAKGAVDHAQEVLEKEGLTLDLFDKKTILDPTLTKKVSRFSPHQNIDSLKAKVFILHEKSDAFVPYTESIKLKRTLEKKSISKEFHQAKLFEHVQPKKGLSLDMLKEFFGLFIFLHKVFIYL